MIIKSHIRGGFRSAADYLKEQGQNEKTRLVEISDPHAKTLDEAFRAMWAVAEGTRAKKPLHHISINPMKDERLTDKQVLRIVERLEEKYGYTKGDHQRVIVEHIKDGRQHFHVMWNRVSLSTGRPIYPYMHKKQSKIAAREMEIELGLKKPVSRGAKFGFSMKAKGVGSAKLSGSLFYSASAPRIGFSIKKKAGGLGIVLGIVKPSGALIRSAPAQHVRTTLRPMSGFRPIPARALLTEPTRFHHAVLVMKGNSSGMGEEQRADYKAACDGKITWQQYFRKWGNANGMTSLSNN
jgi:hypothetical protein